MSTAPLHPDDLRQGASDETLLAAARGGSLGAFGVLYDRYRSYAVDVARAALPKADVRYAEDVAEAAFEAAVDQLREAQRAVLGASTVMVATAVRNAASNAAEIVVVADDEYPNVVYLSEVRDAAGVTIGERFDDDWVSKLDDELREHMGNASVYGDYDLTGGEQLTLDVRNLIWSS